MFVRLTNFLFGTILLMASSAAFAQSPVMRPIGDDSWYYRLGGGENFIAYRQSKRTNLTMGVGADWRMFRGCEFDPRISIAETFRDAQLNLYSLADDLVDSAEGMITAWGLSKIQEQYPTLYDFIMNGAKDASQKYQLAMKSCRDYQGDLNNGRDPSQGWLIYGMSSTWAGASETGENPVAVDETISREAADKGITWIDGERRGGANSEPINIISDSTRLGYEHLATEDAGGAPLGANELGAGMDNPTMAFATVEDAQAWMNEVLGERTISTCKDCDKLEVKVGQGLRLKLVEEKEIAMEQMQLLMNTSNPTLEQLDALSVPALGLVVTDKMVRQIRGLEPYEAGVFSLKLASEIAMMKVMEKALTARDIIKVGMQEPNVAANAEAILELEAAKGRLDAEINDLLFESEIRKKVFSQTALTLNTVTENKRTSGEVNDGSELPDTSTHLKGGALIDE